METKFTNDKWKVMCSGSDDEIGSFHIYSDVKDIADVHVDGQGDEPVEDARKIAHLIAAAPELYEALEVALAELEQHEPPDEYPTMQSSYAEIMKQIREALVKARGENTNQFTDERQNQDETV